MSIALHSHNMRVQGPVTTIAMLESLQNASRIPEAWGILVDTGAATSVAPQSFASDIELSPAPSTFKLTTATGKEVQIYGLRTSTSSESRSELESQLCGSRCAYTFVGLGYHDPKQLELVS